MIKQQLHLITAFLLLSGMLSLSLPLSASKLSDFIDQLKEESLSYEDASGMTICDIVFYRIPPFYGNDFIEFFNFIHTTTLEPVVRHDLLFKEGDAIDPAYLSESKRVLQRNGHYSEVEIIVDASTSCEKENAVNIIVLTHDLWTLEIDGKANTAGGNYFLQIAVNEENFLGLHTELVGLWALDPYRYGFLQSFIVPNLFGTDLVFTEEAGAYYRTQTSEFDGYKISLTLTQPRKNLFRNLSFSVSASAEYGTKRFFKGSDPFLLYFDGNTYVSNPDDATYDSVYVYEYGFNKINFSTSASYAFLSDLGDQNYLQPVVSLGFSWIHESYWTLSAIPDAIVDQLKNKQFIPLIKAPQLSLSFGLNRLNYVKYKNVNNFYIEEEFNMGFSTKISLGRTIAYNGINPYTTLSYNFNGSVELGKQFISNVNLVFSSRLSDSGVFNDAQITIDSRNYLLLPLKELYGNFVWRLFYYQGFGSAPFFLGAETGNRGFPNNALLGSYHMGFNLEYRTLPVDFSLFDAGFVLFYDLSSINLTLGFNNFPLYHSFGIGIRAALTFLNSNLARFDFAIGTPVQGGNLGGGYHFAFTFNYDQAF